MRVMYHALVIAGGKPIPARSTKTEVAEEQLKLGES